MRSCQATMRPGTRRRRPPATDSPAMRALANAAILLGAMALCLTNNALSLALVLPITVASVLLQFDFATRRPLRP